MIRNRCAFLLLSLFLFVRAQERQATVDFLRDVQPVLTGSCMPCHSGAEPQAGLQIHTRDELLRGGRSGPAIVPGDGGGSLLVLKMRGTKGLRMPPSGPPLPGEVIDKIRVWIDQGARFDGAPLGTDPVAPLALRMPPVPLGPGSNPVDRFIGAYWKANGIPQPAVVSDGRFARRAYLDVVGLPPRPEQLQAFERDRRPNKRPLLIERLLSDRLDYAEHWMTFWNDLLRNDEGVIYHGERKSVTDWLRNALEDNMPYDQMTRALLNPVAKAGPEGFLTGVTWRGVVSASQTPPMQAAQNSAQIFLGMNLKCAACHDSFVNRWKLRDTYGLASMFSDSPLELVRCDVPLGKQAEARFPFSDFSIPFGETLASRREAAAEWFVDRRNGRFARTVVNRYWKQLLGRGIVEPVDDMDARPWNADLLDWLAFDFVEHGYDLKHLLRRIMTSRAYETVAVDEVKPAEKFVFTGPRPRRLTAEQFSDSLSDATGDWRVSSPRTDTFASFTREWRLKSDPLSRALGRPIRDQVYTERNSEPTTLQALELTNGPLLAARLEHCARALLGEVQPAPSNIFDSKMVRRGLVPVDVDITGAKELWLLIEDVDTYDTARVRAGWTAAEFVGPSGVVKLSSLPGTPDGSRIEMTVGKVPVSAVGGSIPSSLHWNIQGQGFTRFRAKAAIDDIGQQSDVNSALRFFVFTEKPNPEHLIRLWGEPLSVPAKTTWDASELAIRLYVHLLSRRPTAVELRTALDLLGDRLTSAGVQDLLWALLMTPEFQYIH